MFTFKFNNALFMVMKKGDERHLHEYQYLTPFNWYVRAARQSTGHCDRGVPSSKWERLVATAMRH